MTLARGEREWALLVSEYNICKKKLESKRQALKILMGDLESCQRERDIYKNKIKQMQQEIENYNRQELENEPKDQRGRVRSPSSPPIRSPEHTNRIKRERKFSGQSIWDQELQSVRDRKNKTLSQLLCEAREENKALKNDFKDLRVLYREAQEDIILLRENVARQRASDKGSGKKEDLEARQNLIQQLEGKQEKFEELDRELQAEADEKSELLIERDHYRDKVGRLNIQLNFILGADDKRLVDIDAILMENRYQKEQIIQLKEENRVANTSLARYKAAMEKKKARLAKAGYTGSNVGMKQALPSIISELSSSFSGGVSSSTISDLQSLANSLSESLSEKDTALLHQRNTNKILGNRVAELEKKLKTLEVSGLWSLEGHRGYGSEGMLKLYLEMAAKRSPIPSNTEPEIIQASDVNGEILSPESSPDLNNVDSVFFAGDPETSPHDDQLLISMESTFSEEEEQEYFENNNESSQNDQSCCSLEKSNDGDSLPKGDSLEDSLPKGNSLGDSLPEGDSLGYCLPKGDSLGDSLPKGDSLGDSFQKGDSLSSVNSYTRDCYSDDSKDSYKGCSSRKSSERSPLNTQEKHYNYCKYGSLGKDLVMSSESFEDKTTCEYQSQSEEDIQTLENCQELFDNSTEQSKETETDQPDELCEKDLESQSNLDNVTLQLNL